MKIDSILGIINNLDYDGVEEVKIPVSHLIQLRQTILAHRTTNKFLKDQLASAKEDHRIAVAEGIKILARQEKNSTVQFDSYA